MNYNDRMIDTYQINNLEYRTMPPTKYFGNDLLVVNSKKTDQSSAYFSNTFENINSLKTSLPKNNSLKSSSFTSDLTKTKSWL